MMELLEIKKIYDVFTKNDRGIGKVIYHKATDYEDIVFVPYFRKPGDPWIGALNGSIETDGWKTSRELFGRYLDDPEFRLGCPTIAFALHPYMKVPQWMGGMVFALAEFHNDGSMVCHYSANGYLDFLYSVFEYDGEMDLNDALRFASKKIEEDARRVEFLINNIDPRHLKKSCDSDSHDDDEEDY